MTKYKTYIIATLCALVSSCTVWDLEVNKDIKRPGSYIKLQLKDSSIHLIYDNHDKLFRVVEYTPLDARRDSLLILDGVPDVHYKMVSYFNYNQYDVSNLLVQYTDINNTIIALKGSMGQENFVFKHSADNIHHAYNEFKAEWGQRNTIVVNPNNRIYTSTVEITSEDGFDFWRDMTNFTIDFRNVPSAILPDGKWSQNKCTYTIEEFTEKGEVAAYINLPKFEDNHLVEMHAVQNGVSIGSLPVTPSQLGVNPFAPGEEKFNIQLYLNPQRITVMINGWTIGTIQNTTLGDKPL